MTKHEAARLIVAQHGNCAIPIDVLCTDSLSECPARGDGSECLAAFGPTPKKVAWFEAWLLANPEPVEEKKEVLG